MRVTFKKTAIEDIQSTQAYIAQKLHNRAAANKLTAAIYRAAMSLEQHPCLGAKLGEKVPMETDFRFLVVSKQLIFYRVVEGERVEVTRVLDERQDYLSILF